VGAFPAGSRRVERWANERIFTLSSRKQWALLGIAGLVGIAAFGLWWRSAAPAVTGPQPKEEQVSDEIQFKGDGAQARAGASGRDGAEGR
jgi:hypothetical protein